MTIEEKARSYDEAIERAKEINREHSKKGFKPSDDVLYIFPELKESKDEREIRKALIHLISEQDGFLTAINGISVKDILAWLEKQDEQILANSTKACKGEQKPNDKIEPKFKKD